MRSMLDEGVLAAREAVLRAAEAAGVEVSFGSGRRRSDLTLALLRGERLSVLTTAPRVADELPVAVEIVHGAAAGGGYELMVAVTERLERQPLRWPERRAKLRGLAGGPFVDGETARLLQVGDVG